MNSSLTNQTDSTFRFGCNAYTLSRGTVHQSPFARSFLIFMVLFNGISCPLIVILNMLVMVAVKVTPRLRAQKSNLLHATLASTDFMVGLLVQPVFIAKLMTALLEAKPRWTCLLLMITKTGISCLSMISVIHLALLSGERFLALQWPFAHANLVTTSRLLFSSGLVWLVSISLHTIDALNSIVFIYTSSVLISVTVMFIIFCHLVVFRETRRHLQCISAHQVTQRARQQYEKDKKAFKVTTITVVVLLLCFLPYVVLRIVLFTHASEMSSEHVRIVGDLTMSTVLLNSLLNPVIYSVRIKQLRVSIKDLLNIRV